MKNVAVMLFLYMFMIGFVAGQYEHKVVENVFQRVRLLNELEKLKPFLLKNPLQNITCLDVVKNIQNFNVLKLSNSTVSCLKDACLELTVKDWISLTDAAGKIPSGLLSGSRSVWTGNYEECVNIKHAKYCLQTGLLLGGKLPLAVGLCVPDSCSSDNVNEIVIKSVKEFGKIGNVTWLSYAGNPSVIGNPLMCHSKETQFSTGAIVMQVISSLILLLCVIGTVAEVMFEFVKKKQTDSYSLHIDDTDYPIHENETLDKPEDSSPVNVSIRLSDTVKGSTFTQFLICFSLIKNTKSIFNSASPPGAIGAINGIRVLSITWVVEGHLLLVLMQYSDNMLEVFAWIPRFTMQTILNAPVSVDSFFLLSGLLVGYLSMKRYQSAGKLPLLRYYLHRLFRLTPSYMFVVFFYAYLFPTLTNGPFWSETGKQNCIAWSWYLANDMQFYVVSPLILYLMYKFKWTGVFIVNGILLLANFLTNAILIYEKDASMISYNPHAKPALFQQDSPSSRYSLYIYIQPWTRMAPYLVGLILGYMFIMKTKYKGQKQYLFYGVGWFLAIGMGVAVVYGPYTATYYEWKMPSLITYGVLFRFVWAVAVAWVIYACHNGYGDKYVLPESFEMKYLFNAFKKIISFLSLVNDFLSWKAFIPLSRLTYSVYLIHILVIGLFGSAQDTLLHITVMNLVFYSVSIIVLSYACAYILVVTIEYPVFNLEKLFFNF